MPPSDFDGSRESESVLVRVVDDDDGNSQTSGSMTNVVRLSGHNGHNNVPKELRNLN